MTILEAIKTNEMFLGLSTEKINLIADYRDINTSQLANKSSLKNVELVTADLYSEILVRPDFSEGALSITYDKAQLESYINRVAYKYNDAELLAVTSQSKPMVDKSDKW